MKIFKLEVEKTDSNCLSIHGSFGKDSGDIVLRDVPNWLGDKPTETWFKWGCKAFKTIFGENDNKLRQLWEREFSMQINHFDSLLLQIGNMSENELSPFKWYWEAMIGTISSKPTCYPLSRLPSPVDIVRTPRLPLTRSPCHEPVKDGRWKLALIRVPSQDSNETINLEYSELRTYLNDLQQKYNNFNLIRESTFNGNNAQEISQVLQANNVHLVNIVAHCARINDEDRPDRIAVGNGEHVSWDSILDSLGSISSVQIILLTCCFSDHFVKGTTPPAILLSKKGVPAVIAWNPKPYYPDTSLPFHRAFFWAMAEGNHVARAMSIARSAIFNAINPEVLGGWWINAFAPRLYLHESANIEQLHFPKNQD